MKHSCLAWITASFLMLPCLTNCQTATGPWIDYQFERDRVELDRLKSRPRFESVSPQMIEAAFQEQVAPHPRLVASRGDFDRLRQALAARDAYVVATVDGLKKKAEAYRQDPLIPYELDAANLRLVAPHQRQDHIVVMSLFYQLTGETLYAEKVKAHLLHFAAFSDWNDGKHFLDTGIMSYSMALGYDWIYEYMTAEERSIVRDALLKKGIQPYLQRTGQKRPPFWYQSPNNWNPICNGGISLAALAIMDESDALRQLGAEVLSRALKALPFYIREFEPDGQTVEGMMYWGYGLTNFIRWMESMKRSLGTDFGYTDQRGLQLAGEFPLAVTGPVSGISLGDDPVRSFHRNQTFFWFAKRYQNKALARYHQDEVSFYEDYKWFDLLFYDSSLLNSSASTTSLPLDRYIRDLEYISFRSSWNHEDALYVGVHGGDNRASHGHLDAGTFFVQGGGQVWAVGGLGSDNYTFPGYFSPKTLPGYEDAIEPVTQAGRFHMYRLRAEGKNTLVFNPDMRPDQDPSGTAVVERILTRPDDALAILNLSGVYHRDAFTVRRGIGLRQKRQAVVIQDEFLAKAPSEVWWSMHTLAAAEILHHGRVAVLKQGGKKLWVEIQAPAHAVFTVLDATYLPGQTFPLSMNSPNIIENFKVQKLAIHLSHVTDQTLTVSMKMLNESEANPVLPGTVPLDRWIQSISSP